MTVKPVLIFDFWGTIAQTGVYSPVKQIKSIIKPNISFKDYINRMQRALLAKDYSSMHEGFKAVYEEFGIEPTNRKIDDLVGMWNKNWILASLFEDAEPALKKLKQKYDLILIANSDKSSVNNVVNKFALKDYFEKIYLSCEIGAIKSDSEFLKKVLLDLEEKGVEKHRITLVGDGIFSDILPAKAAGIKAILVDRFNKRNFEKKVIKLTELEEVI